MLVRPVVGRGHVLALFARAGLGAQRGESLLPFRGGAGEGDRPVRRGAADRFRSRGRGCASCAAPCRVRRRACRVRGRPAIRGRRWPHGRPRSGGASAGGGGRARPVRNRRDASPAWRFGPPMRLSANAETPVRAFAEKPSRGVTERRKSHAAAWSNADAGMAFFGSGSPGFDTVDR